MSNQDWWPNQVDLSVLHQHPAASNPMGEDFNYAEEFKTLDVEALKQDLIKVMTTSQDVVASRLRPLRAVLHPDEPGMPPAPTASTMAGAVAARAPSASPLSTAGPTTPASTRPGGCSGRSSRSTAGRSPGPT